MKNTIITLLGGYTKFEMAGMRSKLQQRDEAIADLKIRLAQAEKNDQRDGKGRFTKKK